MPIPLGQVLLERYRIDAQMGLGGFGAVYRAWDLRLDVAVAVKENLSPTAQARRQFQREAQILAKLTHPSLPRVSDHFSIPEQGDYLVMDFVEGEDLEHILVRNRAPIPEKQAAEWIGQICDALSYLHAQTPAVIHRDIKPANIKIRPDGRAMLVDFGIAKVHDTNQWTKTGARGYTPGYAPVEQYTVGATDTRSDIYALGATLYHLITNTVPIESIQRIRRDDLRRPRQLNPALSAGIETAVLRAMAVDADRRYRTAAAFKDALSALPAARPPAIPPTIVVKPRNGGNSKERSTPSTGRIIGLTGLAGMAALIGLMGVVFIASLLYNQARSGFLSGGGQATQSVGLVAPPASTATQLIHTAVATDTPLPVGEVIKVGAIGELSGDFSPVGEGFKNGADLAVGEINAAGGLVIGGKRHPIELVLEDNASDEARSASVARKLIEQDDVVAIIGLYVDPIAAQTIETAESNRVVLISPKVGNIDVYLDDKTEQDLRYFFHIVYSDSFGGSMAAQFSRENLKSYRAAVLYHPYSEDTAAGFKQTFEASGGQVVAFESYEKEDKDFTSQLTRIKDANPDVLFLPNFDDDVLLQVQQAHRLGIETHFLGDQYSSSPEMVEKCGNECDGFYSIETYSRGNPATANKKFIDLFEAKHQYSPGNFEAHAYDSFGLLWQALQTAGKPDRQAVRDALASIEDFPGVTGSITFEDGSGYPIKSALILQVKDGQIVYYTTVEP